MATDSVFVANAVGVWKGALERADKFFNSLSEEELQHHVAPDRNRLIYLWGHLTAMHASHERPSRRRRTNCANV